VSLLEAPTGCRSSTEGGLGRRPAAGADELDALREALEACRRELAEARAQLQSTSQRTAVDEFERGLLAQTARELTEELADERLMCLALQQALARFVAPRLSFAAEATS
jgi:hypothetical protein